MKKQTIKILSFIIFLLAMAIITLVMLPLIQSYQNPEVFKALIESFGSWGIPMMLFIQVFQVVVALIPGEVVETLAGVIYGTFGGFLFCMMGIAVGQIIIFGLVRSFGKDFVEKVAGSKSVQNFSFLRDERKLKTVIFFLFFIPGTPKDLITYMAPMTKINLKDFLIITLIARIPSVLSSTYGGSTFIERNLLKTAIVYSVIGMFSIVGILLYRFWDKKQTEKRNIKNKL
ncbi:MAG: TVP38/TMEM64 family protein [Clostridia bacterium]|nr:TVP38/TMEM64 family protein [Clostridia bacterium]